MSSPHPPPPRRGTLLVLVLILVAVLVSAGASLIIALLGPAAAPSIPSNATLYLRIEAPFPEIEPNAVLSQFVRTPPTLRATVDVIRRAKTDSRVAGMVIEPRAGGAMWAQIQEVRAALDDFKSSGKPLAAFLEAAGAMEYYLAASADRVVLMPAGQLDLVGLASYELFFRGTLDKAGIYPDLLHIGDYKSASNTFTERGFTPEHREMTESLTRDWFHELLRGVASGRKMPEAAVREAVDAGPFVAEAALKAGLVDELAYEDQLDDREPIQGTRRLDGDDYRRAGDGGGRAGGRIAVLYALGTITSGESQFDSFSGMVLGSDTFAEWLRRVRVDTTIDAVVIRVDSPGGSAIASEVIWREIMLTREVKPVVISMGDVAASGGYYLAAAGHAIVAQPGTLTGSIGVVTGKFVLQGALDKLGVGAGAVTHGRLAGMYSPFTPFSREERARVEEQMQTTYELFLQRVAQGRGAPVPKIDAVAQGRVWTGRQARELGLVDELGGLDRAIQIAAERARLDPSRRPDLVVYPPARSLYEVLANPFGTSLGGWSVLLDRRDAAAMDAAAAVFQRFRRGEPLLIMPNVFLH
jgi:protease-4